MDKMSFFSILTVSVPEAILDIYVAFVLTGQRNKLYLDDKLNVIRLIISVCLITTVAVTTRAILYNILLIVLANIIIYTIIIKFVYRIKWPEAFSCVIIIFAVLITVEGLYIPIFVNFVSKSLSNLYAKDMLRFISTIPVRVIQVAIIVSFWKWDLVYLRVKGSKRFRNALFLLMFVLLFTEAIYSFLFVYNLHVINDLSKVIFSIGGVLLVIFNILLRKVVIKIFKEFATEK